MGCLDDGGRLIGAIINAYISLMDIPRDNFVFGTYVYPRLNRFVRPGINERRVLRRYYRRKGMSSIYDFCRLFFPIYINSGHWALACVNLLSNVISLSDSLPVHGRHL